MVFCLLSILFLGFLFYTALVIKHEKKHYLKNAQCHQLGRCILKIPSWWSLTERKVHSLHFTGNHGHQAVFSWESPTKDLEEDFLAKVKKEQIIFDASTSVIWEKIGNYPCLRIEGTATKKGYERLYYDACLIKTGEGQLFSRSYSGVLEGLLQGPWFDDILKNLIFSSHQEPVGIS